MKAMPRGFSVGKQVKTSANTKMRSCLFHLHKRKRRILKNDNRKIWVEMIAVTFLMEYTTVEVSTSKEF